MKKLFKVLSASFLAIMLIVCSIACTNNPATSNGDQGGGYTGPVVDYVAQHKFDEGSGRAYQEVTVKMFIDGDTTHFTSPKEIKGSTTVKARYLAINTPESTGKIEPFGKSASKFTKEKLSNAASIILESDTETWNVDSTGERVLSWVWYKPQGGSEYRLLNLELLQNGLAIASSTANNTYGSICTKALNQAKAQMLKVHGSELDPDMYYGETLEVTLRELRANIEYYSGKVVGFEGVVTRFYNNGVYVEEYDEETQMYYAMYVYYGFNAKAKIMEILSVGNRVRIAGSVQFWEAGGTYQVTDLEYDARDKTNPRNVQLISEGHAASYKITTADQLVNGIVSVEIVDEEGNERYEHVPYAELAMNTSITVVDLLVTDTYTTDNEDSSSKGAFTLTCQSNGVTVEVRTAVLFDENGNLVTADAYLGKTITVKGFVDYYDSGWEGDTSPYQIKVLSVKDLIIQE